MSASQTKLLASRKRSDLSEEEYDSEEERYFRKQERLLKKVEESAKAIRTLTEITRPFITGTWRLEREELRSKGLPVTTASGLPCKENNPRSEECSDDECSSSSFKRIVWSPVKHVKANNDESVLAMEKIPQFKSLRKSKVRLSGVQKVESDTKSHLVEDKPQNILSTPSKCILSKSPCKATEEPRTPLKTVGSMNQTEVRKLNNICSSQDVAMKSGQSFEVQQPHEFQSEKDLICDDKCSKKLTEQTPTTPTSQSKIGESTPIRKSPRFQKSFKSPVRCSPVLLQAYGKEFAQVHGSIGSPDKVVNLEECASPKDPSKVLKGIVAYVEVRRGEDDRTGGFRWKLKQLGATVSDTLIKKVTHVVFQEGLLSTFRKAKQFGVYLVSPLWVMACDESFTKVAESRYTIENLSQYEEAESDPLQKWIKRPKIMSPDLGTGRDEKRLSKRFKSIERRSMMRVESPLAKSPKATLSETPQHKFQSPKYNLKPKSPKSQSNQKTEGDSDDDWDGFLAMIEKEVRDKAETKMKTGDMKSVPDFETRLQQLLGKSSSKDQEDKNEAATPFASIFERKKGSNAVLVNISPKKVKRNKPKVNSATSSSAMMNWLQMRSSETSKTSMKGELSVAAASSAADKILKSLFQSVEVEKNSKVKMDTCGKDSKKTLTDNTRTQSVETLSIAKEDNKMSLNQPSQECSPFVFTARSKSAKTDLTVKQPAKKAKLDFNGSQACSNMMRNWLSGAKSQTPSHKSPAKMIGDQSNGINLTPRRRSLRLTPLKNMPVSSYPNQLDPLEEDKECLFRNKDKLTPNKVPSKLEASCSSIGHDVVELSSSPLKASSSIATPHSARKLDYCHSSTGKSIRKSNVLKNSSIASSDTKSLNIRKGRISKK